MERLARRPSARLERGHRRAAKQHEALPRFRERAVAQPHDTPRQYAAAGSDGHAPAYARVVQDRYTRTLHAEHRVEDLLHRLINAEPGETAPARDAPTSAGDLLAGLDEELGVVTPEYLAARNRWAEERIDCQSYREHQGSHRWVDGRWRCDTCEGTAA